MAQKQRPSVWDRLCAFGWFNLIGLMLGLGVVFAWASVFWVPNLKRWGVPIQMADRVPFAAFFCGVAWGFAVSIHEEPKWVLYAIGTIFGLGALFWFGGLLVGSLLVALGVPDKNAEMVSTVAFYLGLLAGLLVVMVKALERLNMPRATDVLLKVMAIPFSLVVVAFIVFEFVAGALFVLTYIDVILIMCAAAAAIIAAMVVLGKLMDLYMHRGGKAGK